MMTKIEEIKEKESMKGRESKNEQLPKGCA